MLRRFKDEPTALLGIDVFDLGGELAKPSAPTEFRIFRKGINKSDKGDFVFDDEAAASVMAAFAKKGTALTIDYEHQAAQDPPVVAPAAASSWVPEIREGELWATKVNWTDKARQMIEAREYTRFSPYFTHEPKTLRIRRVINGALTNVEALDGFEPLVAATALSEGVTTMKPMKCKACTKSLRAPTDDNDGDDVMCTACGAAPKMLTAIGLRVDASGPEALTALSALTTFRSTVFELTGKENAMEALAVLTSWKGKEAEVTALRAAAEKADGERLQAELNGVFEGGVKAGKISPDELDALRASLSAPLLKMSGGKVTADVIAALKVIVDGRPVKASSIALTQKKPNGADAVALSAEDKFWAERMGNKTDDVEKYKASVAAANGGNA